MAIVNPATLLKGVAPLQQFPGDLMLQGENAFQTLAEQLAGIDAQQGQVGTNYERQRADLGYQNQDAIQSIMDAMANRGTLRSGLTNRAMARQGRTNTSLLDQLANAKQSALSGLAQQRLSAQGGYNQTMANLQSAFAGQSNAAIQQAMQAEAARKQQEQQALFNQSLMQQNQGFQQQVLNSLNQPQPDYSGMFNVQPNAPTAGTTGPSGQISPTPSNPGPIAGAPPAPQPIQPRPYPKAVNRPRAV